MNYKPVKVEKDGKVQYYRSLAEFAHIHGYVAGRVNEANRKGKTYDGWTMERVSKDNFDTSLLTLTDYVPEPRNVVRDEGEEEDDREAIMVGEYNSEFAPAICPVCQMVGVRYEHIVRCLRGHEYSWKGNVIKVFK